MIKVPFKVPIILQGMRGRQGALGAWIHSKGISLLYFFFCATVSFRGLHKFWERMADACHFETVFASSAFLPLVFLNMIGS